MPVEYKCPCGEVIEVDDAKAGGTVVCPACKKKGKAPLLDSHLPDGSSYHPGQKPEDADFFMPQPKKIGTLRSSHTSLARSANSRPIWLRVFFGMIGSAGISFLLAVCLFFCLRLPLDACAGLFVVFSIVITPFAVGLMVFYTRFRHYCGYVGDQGVAYYTCSVSRQRVKINEVFLFREAKELRVHLLDILLEGSYQKTDYYFSWTDESGAEVFLLHDAHYSKTQQPPWHDMFHMALSAENAWSDFMLEKIMPQLAAGKAWTFALKGKDRIIFRKDRFELHLRGKVQAFHPQDLSEAPVEYGNVKLKEPGGKEGWITSHGVHTFPYGDLANARAFLALLQRLKFFGPAAIAPR